MQTNEILTTDSAAATERYKNLIINILNSTTGDDIALKLAEIDSAKFITTVQTFLKTEHGIDATIGQITRGEHHDLVVAAFMAQSRKPIMPRDCDVTDRSLSLPLRLVSIVPHDRKRVEALAARLILDPSSPEIYREGGNDATEAALRQLYGDSTEIVRPATTVSNTVVNLTIGGDECYIVFKAKNEAFREVVKNIGFKWQNFDIGWMARPSLGDVKHLAAYTIAKLLKAGFIVKAHKDLIAKAQSGEYTVPPTRVIRVSTDGRFLIEWAKSEDLYSAARGCTGSKWVSPYVAVPASSYLDVMNLAAKYKFTMSPRALKLCEEQKEIKDSARQVEVATLKEGKQAPATLPAPGTVLQDLADED